MCGQSSKPLVFTCCLRSRVDRKRSSGRERRKRERERKTGEKKSEKLIDLHKLGVTTATRNEVTKRKKTRDATVRRSAYARGG